MMAVLPQDGGLRYIRVLSEFLCFVVVGYRELRGETNDLSNNSSMHFGTFLSVFIRSSNVSLQL
jgi:hypothetical protein